MLFHKCKRTDDETVCSQERADYLEKIIFAGLCSMECNLIYFKLEIEVSIKNVPFLCDQVCIF